MAVVLVACGTKPNPLYCDENSDCRNGTVCNLDTNGCEMVAAVDAADDGPTPDGPYVARTVQEVRALSTPIDTPVELTGVVVAAVDRYGDRKGDVWVQEFGGGPASGVHVYGMLDDDVAQIQIGDRIDIRNARKVTFTLGGDTSGRTEIQVHARLGGMLSTTKTGMTSAPIRVDMDVAAIAAMSQPQLDQEREKWAGMLVRVASVEADGPPTMPVNITQFGIGPFLVNDTQVALPSGIVMNTCFGEIIGIIEYARGYNLVPREAGDISVGGAGCP